MSGHHHKRVGWTYGPRPRGICAGCNIGRTLTKSGLVIKHRQRVNGKPGIYLCPGSMKPPQEAQSAAPEQADPTGPYRELLRFMIEADERCQSPTCGVTMLGHLLAGLPPHLVDLVRAEDPEESPR